MKYIIGVDIGTTNMKAVMYDTKGQRCASASVSYPTTHTVSGFAEQDPDAWYSGTVSSIKEVVLASGVDRSDILCVCFDGHIRSVGFFDRNFEVVYPGIIWSDTRSHEIAKQINENMGKELCDICGNVADTNYALSNIVWIQQNRPECWEKVAYLANPKDYILYRFTGEFVSDPSNQAGSLMLDLESKDWSDSLISRFGIKREMLPKIRKSTDVAGYLTRQAAEDTLLDVGLPIIVGGGDNDTAALGAGVCRKGILSVSLGTAGIILTLLDKPIRQVTPSLDVFPHVMPDKWYAMGMLKAAGYAVDWLKRQSTEVSASHLSTSNWFYKLWNTDEDFVPGNDGLFCFPYFQGRGNPSKDATAKGAYLGITAGHTTKHFVQATMEGVAYRIRQCVETIEKHTPIDSIVCCGGGASNHVWLQIIASVINKPVMRGIGSDEGALGCAVMGAVAMGVFPTMDEACEAMIGAGDCIYPIAEQVAAYDKLFDTYCGLSTAIWGE